MRDCCSSGRRTTWTSPPPHGPTAIETVLRGWADAMWDMGRDFGTIGARLGDTEVEITTYRADSY